MYGLFTGIMADDAAAAPVPMTVVAATNTVYDVPVSNPVSVAVNVVGPVTIVELSGLELIVYPVIG
jgi:hypothetical protein